MRRLPQVYCRVGVGGLVAALLVADAVGQAPSAKEVYRKAVGSVVVVTAFDANAEPLALGTGFYVQKGLVATSLHVLEGAKSLQVRRAGGGGKLRVKGIHALSARHDIALVRTEESGKALTASTDRLEPGDTVYAIGNPEGLIATLSTGIVSGLRTFEGTRMYQITAPISPGSSGGPVLDSRGRVIGIATSQIEGGQNLNFAVDMRHVADLIKSRSGSVVRPLNIPPRTRRTTPKVKTNPKDGAAMVYVPAGEFTMGSNDDFQDEEPQRRVYLDAYWIYKHEVTVAQYRKFCGATGRQMPDAPWWGWKDDHPIVSVTWHDAKAYADWAGVALPTEAQWEKAARGTDGRAYVWGDQWPPPPKVGNFADETAKRKDKGWSIISGYDDGYAETSPVGVFPAGASPYGCLDMAGNVWEWCADWYDENYYAKAPSRNPKGPQRGVNRVLRCGSWHYGSGDFFRASYRLSYYPDDRNNGLGFRCVLPVGSS